MASHKVSISRAVAGSIHTPSMSPPLPVMPAEIAGSALGAAGAVRPLSALLADRSEKNVHLKRSCAAALAAIGRPRGIRALVDALAAEDVYVRQGATSALEGTGADLSGYDPRAGEEENRAALARVRAWGATKFGAAWDE